MKTEKEIKQRIEAYQYLLQKEVASLEGYQRERVKIAIDNLEWVFE